MADRPRSNSPQASSRPAHLIDPEEDAFNNLPFVGEEGCPWKPPTIGGPDFVTVRAAEWLLGETYAAAFLAHSRAFAASHPHRPRENILNIFGVILTGSPSSFIVKGFLAGLGDAIAHGAVELDTSVDLIVRPGRVVVRPGRVGK